MRGLVKKFAARSNLMLGGLYFHSLYAATAPDKMWIGKVANTRVYHVAYPVVHRRSPLSPIRFGFSDSLIS